MILTLPPLGKHTLSYSELLHLEEHACRPLAGSVECGDLLEALGWAFAAFDADGTLIAAAFGVDSSQQATLGVRCFLSPNLGLYLSHQPW